MGMDATTLSPAARRALLRTVPGGDLHPSTDPDVVDELMAARAVTPILRIMTDRGIDLREDALALALDELDKVR